MLTINNTACPAVRCHLAAGRFRFGCWTVLPSVVPGSTEVPPMIERETINKMKRFPLVSLPDTIMENAAVSRMNRADVGRRLETRAKHEMSFLCQGVPEARRGLTHESEVQL